MKIKTTQNSLASQHGAISKLMLFMIIGAIGYGIYHAKNKGFINKGSIGTVTSQVNQYSAKIKNSFSLDDNFAGYGVQIMATTQLDQAKSVMEDFANDGYSAFVVANRKKGRTYYKVRLGPYDHKPEAQAIKDKVKRRYPGSPYVKSSFVIYKPE